MKKKILSIAVLAAISIQSNADYVIKYVVEPTPNSIIMKGWFDTDASISEWLNNGLPFDCGVFSPSANTITIGQSFEQSRNCSINQERTIQNRKVSDNGTYKNEGEPIVEIRISNLIETNNSIGSLKTWTPTTAIESLWVNSGSIACSAWTPDPATKDAGTSFEQSQTCTQLQTRTVQNREIETTTNEIRNNGIAVVESQTVTTNPTRESIGTLAPKFCIYDINQNWIYFFSNSENDGLWISKYGNFPVIFTTKTYPQTLAGLNKISASHYTYNDGFKIWNITRGSIMANNYGTLDYQVCFE